MTSIFINPISSYCDLIPIEEFAEGVVDSAFIPYDGDGYFSTTEGMSDVSVWTAGVRVPEGATHVAWFNR